ncbi:MAG TPA: hypothetical protein VMT89_03100 [Candidatus Acidoferrales bacterium]|nr:hypothetical protein [Candidatus Acidoferrales bacterium]
MRWARHYLLWTAAGVWGLACGLGLLRRLPTAAEVLLVVAIFSFLLASSDFVSAIRRTPSMQLVCFAGLAAAILTGHFHGKYYDTFPFVEWDIYTAAPHGDPLLFDYYAVRGDLSEEQLIPAELFPGLGKKITTQLEQTCGALANEAEAADERQPTNTRRMVQQYDGLLRALARAYNRQHADNPLTAIRIERWNVPLQSYRGRESIVRQPFRVWMLTDEPA